MDLIEIKKLKQFDDSRGSLVFLEELNDINFQIKRVYYLFNLNCNEPRGFHAHYQTEQFAICIAGSCEILLDDGQKRQTVKLDKSNMGLYIHKMIWHEMYNFSGDCVLLVLASQKYNEQDYIRNYDDFVKEVNKLTEF